MKTFINHLSLIMCIILAIGSQTIIRWRLSDLNLEHTSYWQKLIFILSLMLDKWFVLAVILTFFAGLLWIYSLTKFDISYAYPWMSLIFIIMMGIGITLFDEPLTAHKIIGTSLVTIGLIIAARA